MHRHVLNQDVPVQIVVTLLAVEDLIRVLILQVIDKARLVGEGIPAIDGSVSLAECTAKRRR